AGRAANGRRRQCQHSAHGRANSVSDYREQFGRFSYADRIILAAIAATRQDIRTMSTSLSAQIDAATASIQQDLTDLTAGVAAVGTPGAGGGGALAPPPPAAPL